MLVRSSWLFFRLLSPAASRLERKPKRRRRGGIKVIRIVIPLGDLLLGDGEMPRIPLIKFPKRNLKAPSPSPPAAQPADQHASLLSRLGAKLEAPSSSGEVKNYRFRSDVPSPPSYTAVGGPASVLPKRKPLSEEEIEAIMQGGIF